MPPPCSLRAEFCVKVLPRISTLVSPGGPQLARPPPLKAELRAHAELTGDNTETRRKFEKAVGTRWVIVTSEEGDRFHDFSGYVMGFFPSEQICVVDEQGRTVSVPLDRVASDVNRWFSEDDPTGSVAAADRILACLRSQTAVS